MTAFVSLVRLNIGALSLTSLSLPRRIKSHKAFDGGFSDVYFSDITVLASF